MTKSSIIFPSEKIEILEAKITEKDNTIATLKAKIVELETIYKNQLKYHFIIFIKKESSANADDSFSINTESFDTRSYATNYSSISYKNIFNLKLYIPFPHK